MKSRSYYSEEELKSLGLKTYGYNVLISRKTSIYGAEHISIGNNVRIDDFCILSGNITLGSYIHIAAYCALWGSESGIVMEDYSAISSRSAVYAASDDYSGDFMTNPTLPDQFRHIIDERITLHKHVIIGSGCTILPGVDIGEGCAVGSMSLVNRSLAPWGIYVGIPCIRKKERSRELLHLEKEFLSEEKY